MTEEEKRCFLVDTLNSLKFDKVLCIEGDNRGWIVANQEESYIRWNDGRGSFLYIYGVSQYKLVEVESVSVDVPNEDPVLEGIRIMLINQDDLHPESTHVQIPEYILDLIDLGLTVL